MDDEVRRFHGFTKEDNRKLQVLQNKVMRLKSGFDYQTPTETLVRICDELSVQQTTAYHTLMMIFKIVRFRKPLYLAKKLMLQQPTGHGIFPHRHLNNIHFRADLTISRGGLVYRGAKLWNSMNPLLKNEEKISKFKRSVRKWIVHNVPAKPP